MKNNIKVIFFDTDETLTDNVSWLYLTEKLGADLDMHKQIYADMVANKITDKVAVNNVLQMWQKTGNASRENIKGIFSKLSLRKNSKEIVDYLSPKYRIVLISGALDILVETVAERFNVKDYFFNSHFKFDTEGYLSDFYYETDQAGRKYHQFLDFIAENAINREDTAMVGNAENDLPLFETAGMSFIMKTGLNDNLLDRADYILEDLLELKKYL